MNPLLYVAGQLQYVVCPPPLSDEAKEKICAIQDINKIQVALTGKPLDTKQFEQFMEMTLTDLDCIICDQSAVLNRLKYDQRKAKQDGC